MIGWVLWFFLVLHLFLLEGIVAWSIAPVLDLTVAVGLFAALFARTSTIPGLLISTALARAALMPGGAAVHLLTLGIPVAVLLPLRGVFSRNVYLWQCAVAAFLAVIQPRLMGLLSRLTQEQLTVASLEVRNLFFAMLVVPPLVLLLRRVPPLRGFQERAE